MMNIATPEYPAPLIAGNSYLLQQVLTNNEEMMRLLYTKDGKGGSKNTNRNPNTSTGPRQRKPCHPVLAYFDKYFWTHEQSRKKVAITSPRHLVTSKSPQFRAGWTGATMDAQNDGL